jgi:hypothetical protein
MMDGGWDQRASGKAYNSSSGCVVSVGGYTKKVCELVYYSKRYEIDKLLDPIHFGKNYKSKLYNLMALSKSKSEICKADAMRLSHNLAYMIAQCTPTSKNTDCTFKDFKTAGKASFEHHWNNHKHCSLWCQAKSWME